MAPSNTTSEAFGLPFLCVRLTAEGEVEIRRFKRCPFCEHPQRGVQINKPWDAWYRSLVLVGIHSQER